MAGVTAAALIERLREIYSERAGERLSDEKLAGRLPISLTTFNRWKRGDTRLFRDIVAMLEEAGWLTVSDGAAAPRVAPLGPPESVAAAIRELLQVQEEILATLHELAGTPQERDGAEPERVEAAPPR